MNNLAEKLSKIESKRPSGWKQKAAYHRKNRDWLGKSAAIALQVLEALKQQSLSQKDSADRMGISPQQINKIVKGQENLTLETIANLEAALGIEILKGISRQTKPAA